jgi:hypothetical protein
MYEFGLESTNQYLTGDRPPVASVGIRVTRDWNSLQSISGGGDIDEVTLKSGVEPDLERAIGPAPA